MADLAITHIFRGQKRPQQVVDRPVNMWVITLRLSDGHAWAAYWSTPARGLSAADRLRTNRITVAPLR